MEVDPVGAAAQAGLRKGDAILKIDNTPVSTSSQLAEQVARKKPGDKIEISFLREGKEQNVEVELKSKLGTFASQKNELIQSLGADFSALSKADAEKIGIEGGVQVSQIHDGIISGQTNMRPGFVITKIGDKSIKSIDDLNEALANQSSNFQIEGIYPGNNEVYYYGINDFRK